MTLLLRNGVRIGLAALMLVSGVGHLVAPRPYIQHLPDTVPLRAELVVITGIMEIVLATGLVGPHGSPTGSPSHSKSSPWITTTAARSRA